MRFDRLAGDDRGDLLGELAVVHGVGHVVGCRGRAVLDVQRRSTTNSWPSRRSCVVDAVAPEDAQARQGDLVEKSIGSSPFPALRDRAARRGWRRRRARARPRHPPARRARWSPRSRGRGAPRSRRRRRRVRAAAPRRGTACGSCRSSTRWPRPTMRVERRAARPSSARPLLPKPMPGSTMSAAGRDAGRRGRVDALRQLAQRPRATTSAYSARAYMSADGPRQCPSTKSASVLGDGGEHVGVGEAAGDVVDDARARRDGGQRGRGVHRVDADRRRRRRRAPR